MDAPRFKDIRRGYGFDEVALVPGDTTISPEQVSVEFTLDNFTFPIPILASAMDAVVDPQFAVLLSKLGGLAVLNLEGLQTRYENADEILAEIANTPQEEITTFLQKVYSQPIKADQERRRYLRRFSDSSEYQKACSHDGGSRRGYFCRPVHSNLFPPHIEKLSRARLLRALPANASANHRGQLRQL